MKVLPVRPALVAAFCLMLCTQLSIAKAASETDATPSPTIEDVLRLRDIGGVSGRLTLSPDSAWVAFVERERRLETDDYRYVVMAAPVAGVPAARAIAEAGDIILDANDGRQSGSAVLRTALWSPDGRWLAFLKRVGDETQLWRAHFSDGDVAPVATGPGDITRFAWSEDGRALVFETLTPRSVLADAASRARTHGFRVDARLEPRYGLTPMPEEASGRQIWIATLGGSARAATAAEAGLLEGAGASNGASARGRAAAARNGAGAAAWFAPLDPETTAYRPLLTVYAQNGDAPARACANPLCRGALINVWVLADASVVFQRTEGFARAEAALYRWDPRTDAVTLIRRAEDVLVHCALSAPNLICLQESTLQPRRIVRIDLESGALALLYDPNPDWRRFAMPRTERIDVHDYRGSESFGRLFYPRGYRAGERYPLVIVQYRARGFVNGGTGGEYPVREMVRRGYFALAIERPDPEDLWARLDLNAAARLTELEHIEQRSKHSAIEALLRALAERGDVDMSRIAITGMSDGAETVYWALMHSRAFAAALVSSPPTDPAGWPLGSEAFRQSARRDHGLSGDWEGTAPEWRRWWRQSSPFFHARELETPLLMQLSDNEALQGFPLYARLRELNRPVEFYIYPGERHVKWRPQHILAVQRRAMAWIDFWLKDEDASDPEDPDRAARWRALRAAQGADADH